MYPRNSASSTNVTSNRLFSTHNHAWSGHFGAQLMTPSNAAPPRAAMAVRVNAKAVTQIDSRKERGATIHGQASSSQKPISGLSWLRYIEKGTASAVKRWDAI